MSADTDKNVGGDVHIAPHVVYYYRADVGISHYNYFLSAFLWKYFTNSTIGKMNTPQMNAHK